MIKKQVLLLAVCLLALALLTACGLLLPDTADEAEEYTAAQEQEIDPEAADAATDELTEDGTYTDAANVALYLHTYGHLPDNYLTKTEAEALGWDSSRGNLWDVAPGCCIGGDRFGNREGLLPKASGRQYYECDVNYEGGYRGGERIVYSDDGLIFYSRDHYASFTQLY